MNSKTTVLLILKMWKCLTWTLNKSVLFGSNSIFLVLLDNYMKYENVCSIVCQ